jgi:hypothetical protein
MMLLHLCQFLFFIFILYVSNGWMLIAGLKKTCVSLSCSGWEFDPLKYMMKLLR